MYRALNGHISVTHVCMQFYLGGVRVKQNLNIGPHPEIFIPDCFPVHVSCIFSLFSSTFSAVCSFPYFTLLLSTLY